MNRLERLAPLSGIVAVGLLVTEISITGHAPAIDTPTRTTVAYWVDNANVLEIASALYGLGAVAIVWFGASLRAALREDAGGSERLGSIAHAGTMFIAAGLSLSACFGLAAVHSAEKSAGGDLATTVQTLNVLNGEDMFMLIAVGSTLLLLSTAVSMLRHGGFPRWVGWVSLVFGAIALVVLVVGVWVAGYGVVSFPLLGLWIPVVAMMIYMRQPTAARAPSR